MTLNFSRLTEQSATQDFDCGDEDLNLFLQNTALLFQKRHFAITMLCHTHSDFPEKLVGYYTLCPASVDLDSLPEKFITGPKPQPIPALRLCRLAVNKKLQGMGYGKILLIHALRKCLEQASQIGGSLVIVDAKHEKAKKFYTQFGFISLRQCELTLIQSMKYIAKHFS